jgi:hypothetical protein
MFKKVFRIMAPFAALAIILAACGAPAASPIPATEPAPTTAAAATPIPPTVTAIPATAAPMPPAATANPATATPAAIPATAASPQAAATDIPEMSGEFQANGRSLYIKCLGTGSPTIVLEPGNGGTVTALKELHATLAGLTTTCAYSRANLGRSGRAPIPRTAKDVVDDLHALLAAAKVPGPYVLVGHEAGGLFVQLYARTYPDQVAGVVALDPIFPAHPWLDDVSKLVTGQEYASEKRSYDGENEESIDFTTSSDQLAAAPKPPDVPFEMVISQCNDPGDQFCVKTYPTAKQISQEIAAAWPRGSFTEVAAAGDLPKENPDAVVAAVERVLASK